MEIFDKDEMFSRNFNYKTKNIGYMESNNIKNMFKEQPNLKRFTKYNGKYGEPDIKFYVFEHNENISVNAEIKVLKKFNYDPYTIRELSDETKIHLENTHSSNSDVMKKFRIFLKEHGIEITDNYNYEIDITLKNIGIGDLQLLSHVMDIHFIDLYLKSIDINPEQFQTNHKNIIEVLGEEDIRKDLHSLRLESEKFWHTMRQYTDSMPKLNYLFKTDNKKQAIKLVETSMIVAGVGKFKEDVVPLFLERVINDNTLTDYYSEAFYIGQKWLDIIESDVNKEKVTLLNTKSVYYNLATILMLSEKGKLSEEIFITIFDYLLKAGNYKDAINLRTKLLWRRLGVHDIPVTIYDDGDTIYKLASLLSKCMK